MTRADWDAATPKCPGRPANIGLQACAAPLKWVTPAAHADEGTWCCPVHGPMLTGFQAAQRAGCAPLRFAA